MKTLTIPGRVKSAPVLSISKAAQTVAWIISVLGLFLMTAAICLNADRLLFFSAIIAISGVIAIDEKGGEK